jgi:hypothetical protein
VIIWNIFLRFGMFGPRKNLATLIRRVKFDKKNKLGTLMTPHPRPKKEAQAA